MIPKPTFEEQALQWWIPRPHPGDPAPYIREWLKEKLNVEEQAHLARAGLVLQKASLVAELEYLNVLEEVANRYMK